VAVPDPAIVRVTVAPGAVAALVLALGLDDEPVRGLVLLHERAGAVVDQGDRAELDLHRARERVPVDRRDGGTGEALRHRRDVVEVRPRLVDRRRDGEPVGQVHQAAPAAASTARRVRTRARWRR